MKSRPGPTKPIGATLVVVTFLYKQIEILLQDLERSMCSKSFLILLGYLGNL